MIKHSFYVDNVSCDLKGKCLASHIVKLGKRTANPEPHILNEREGELCLAWKFPCIVFKKGNFCGHPLIVTP